MEMRACFAAELKRLMAQDERLCVLDADLGRANGTLSLHELYPGRAFDVGIAEQDLMSVAAGMASCGMIPFVTSFTPFATRRACDQVAISIAYAGMNVKIVGTDPGIAAEINGGTHMSVEDIGVLRSIPGIVIFEPVDNLALTRALPQIIAHDGPVYIRMFRKETPEILPPDCEVVLGKAITLRPGKDVTLIASGIMLAPSLTAAEELAKRDISAEVLGVHTVKPLDAQAVERSARKTGAVVTCENHNVIGGLYSAVAECLARRAPTPMAAIGIQDHFGEVGKMPALMQKFHMTAEDIAAAAEEVIARK